MPHILTIAVPVNIYKFNLAISIIFFQIRMIKKIYEFKKREMNKTINIAAAVLLIIWMWIFVFFGFEVYNTIHALPILACIVILVNTLYQRKEKST